MGYVYQGGELGRWYVGLQAFTVGSSFLANRDFVAQSHPYMRRLMEQSGETANLGILDGTEAVFIDQVQCREMMRTIVKLGSRVPLHASGVGKAIFAALPDDEIDAILKVKGLPRITANTITAPETMWASLRVIRQRGWSFDDEEHALGTRCVASPIYDEHAEVLGAISLAGPVVAPARRAHQAARRARRAHRRGPHAPAGRPLAPRPVSACKRGARERVAVVLVVRRSPPPPRRGRSAGGRSSSCASASRRSTADKSADVRLRIDSYSAAGARRRADQRDRPRRTRRW